DGAEVLPNQFGMVLHRLGERTEDDAERRQLLLEGSRDRHAIEHRVNGDAREQLLLLERNAKLLERAADLRIDLIKALECRTLLGRGVVDDVLVIDRPVLYVAPRGLLHRQPGAVRLETPI